MCDNDQLLAAQMAAISAVKSTAIVEAARDAGELNAYQNKLDDSLDRVLEAQKTLQNLEVHEVTPELAGVIDRNLLGAGAEIPSVDGVGAVEGAECLGRTLMPRDYLFTRLAGCENFLTDFFKNSKEVAQRIGASFKDVYVIFTESSESLHKQFDILERTVNDHPGFEGGEDLLLGVRLYNLFKINGKVDEKWDTNLTKLNQTLAGLSSNYYANSRGTIQAIYSYFGGFAKLSEERAHERLLMMPISIPMTPFKECTYPDTKHGGNGIVAKRSVELMGGAYFVDTRTTDKPVEAKNLDEVHAFVTRFTEYNGVGFENNEEYTHKLSPEIKSLSQAEVKKIVGLMRKLLTDWGKIFEQSEKYMISDHDYLAITKDLADNETSDSTKTLLAKYYASIVRKNQLELLHIRAAVSTYLALILNGMVSICHDSIKLANK